MCFSTSGYYPCISCGQRKCNSSVPVIYIGCFLLIKLYCMFNSSDSQLNIARCTLMHRLNASTVAVCVAPTRQCSVHSLLFTNTGSRARA